MFYRLKLGWNIPFSRFDYTSPDGDVIEIPYLSPKDILQHLLAHCPDLLMGGLDTPFERAENLEAFWHGYRVLNGLHVVFQEHGDALSTVVPIYWHGDEGRGKRRSGTCVISIEAPLGIHAQKVASCSCKDDVPDQLRRKFGNVRKCIPTRLRPALMKQRTSMKGHSFLQRWVLIVLPGSIFKTYPDVLPQMLQLLADQFRMLFYEGLQLDNRTYNVAVCGAKGDLKWFAKIGNFCRSFQNLGDTNALAMCHLCEAGVAGVPWEDLSETPCWKPTCFRSRPWRLPPPMLSVPYMPSRPEAQYRSDVFHNAKVGVFRDLAGSSICYLCFKGFFGARGTFDNKLASAHSAFVLYCRATSHTPALRSFSRLLMNYPRFSSYPWCNTKGSDTTLLLKFLVVQISVFQNDPANAAFHDFLETMKRTCAAALGIFSLLNSHGLFVERDCGIRIYAEISRFITGYQLLAASCLNDNFCGWGIKPKLHLWKHTALDIYDALQDGWDVLQNLNSENCEQSEDLIGRVSRLSRRFDSRLICQRVLQACLLKSSLLYRRYRLSKGQRG